MQGVQVNAAERGRDCRSAVRSTALRGMSSRRRCRATHPLHVRFSPTREAGKLSRRERVRVHMSGRRTLVTAPAWHDVECRFFVGSQFPAGNCRIGRRRTRRLAERLSFAKPDCGWMKVKPCPRFPFSWLRPN